MHALEEPVAGDLLRRLAEELLCGERGEDNAALLVMAGDHVGRVLSQQAVTLFAGPDRILRSPIHDLNHHRQRRGIGHGAHGADQGEQHRRQRHRLRRRHLTQPLGRGESHETEPGNARRPGDDTPVRGERSLQWHGHHPRDEPRAEAPREPGAVADESREIRRRGEMGGGESAGSRQKDGNGDGGQKPEKGGSREERRFAADHEINRKDAERDEAADEMRSNEGLMAGSGQRVAPSGMVHERAEIG